MSASVHHGAVQPRFAAVHFIIVVAILFSVVGGGYAGGMTPGELDELTARVQAKLVKLRGLPFLKPVVKGLRTKGQLRDYILALMRKELPDTKIDATAKALVKFGLMRPGTNLKKLIVDLNVEQIAGFYDWRTKQFYLMLQTPPSLQKMILAHELTHVLQDQHFDLARLPLDEKNNDDLLLATQSLIEGEAMGTMIDFVLAPTGKTVLSAPNIMQFIDQFAPIGGGDVFMKAPRFLRETMLFPYTYGLAFVVAVRRKGGYHLLNGVYRIPPQSTEQILHPVKYLEAPDPPCRFSLPNLSHVLGKQWRYLDHSVLGEYGARLVFEQRLVSTAGLTRAVEGWGGDIFGLYQHASTGKVLLGWITTWDTQRDAREFFEALRMWADARFGDTYGPTQGPFTWNVNEQIGGAWLKRSDVILVDGVPPRLGEKIADAFHHADRHVKRFRAPVPLRIRPQPKAPGRPDGGDKGRKRRQPQKATAGRSSQRERK